MKRVAAVLVSAMIFLGLLWTGVANATTFYWPNYSACRSAQGNYDAHGWVITKPCNTNGGTTAWQFQAYRP